MATLDYALLAEYARIDPAGLVTIVGGSFDRVQMSGTSEWQQTYVVMRVLLGESEEDAPFEISIDPPNESYSLKFAGTTSRNPVAAPVDGQFGVMGSSVPGSLSLDQDDVGKFARRSSAFRSHRATRARPGRSNPSQRSVQRREGRIGHSQFSSRRQKGPEVAPSELLQLVQRGGERAAQT